MSKVITFSRVFPITHPRKGEPTYFVEKFWKGLETIGFSEPCYFFDELTGLGSVISGKDYNDKTPKLHTIRAGNRFKAGELFSPRVWSGKPYTTKQIIIAPDVRIKKVFDIEIYPTNEVMINGKFFCSFGSENWLNLCLNDGLSSEDMRNWFNKLPFKGQVICWSDSVNY